MINPPPQYDPNNEAQFRRDVEQKQLNTVRTDSAAPFLLIIDQVTQEVIKVTVESGAFVLTPQ